MALLLPEMARVFQQRVLPRKNLWRRVFCAAAGPWGSTCALQRAGDEMSQLLAAKHQQDMLRWFSAVERFHTLHEHALVAYDADHQLFLVAQRGKSARSSAFGCWRCWNPNLNPEPLIAGCRGQTARAPGKNVSGQKSWDELIGQIDLLPEEIRREHGSKL